MADSEIKIIKKSGAGGSSTREEFTATIPDWALNSTISKLSNKIDLTNEILKSSLDEEIFNKRVSKQIIDNAKDGAEAARATAKAGERTAKAGERTGSLLDADQRDATKRFYYTQSALVNLTKGLASHNADSFIGGALGVLGQAAQEIGEIGHVMSGPVAVTLESFVAIVGFIINSTTKLNKEFANLSENGITYGSSMREITAQTDAAGLTLEEYSAILKKNSATTNYLGTVATGKLITQFNTLSKRGSEYGISQAEADEELMNYADTLRMTGMLQNKSTGDIVKLNDNYQRELGSVVALTGENRKQLEESIKARFTDLDMQVALAALPEQVRQNMNDKVLPEISKAFGEKGAQALNKPLAGYLARGLGGVGPEMTNLLASTGTFDAFQKIGEIAKAGGDPSAALKEFADRLSDPRVSQMMSQFAAFPGPMGDAARQMMELKMSSENLRKGLTADGKKLSDEDKRRMAAQADFNAAMNKLNTVFMEFAIAATPAAIASLKILTSVVNALSTPLRLFSQMLDQLGKFVHNMLGFGDKTTDTGAFKDKNTERHAQIGSGIAQTAVLTAAGALTTMAIKRVFGGKKAVGKGGGLPNLDVPDLPGLGGGEAVENLGGAVGKAGGKRGIGGMLSSLGGGIGDLGKGLGGGISGLLKGVADGLAAFANPATALGLGAVTLAIIGLSAAMRIAAPAFEPFGRMMKLAFEGIGDGLASASKIITNLGAAVGMVIKSVGDSIVTVMQGAAQSLLMISTINPSKLMMIAPAIAAVGASMIPFGVGTATAAAGGALSRTAHALAAGTVGALAGVARRFGGPAAANNTSSAAHTPQTVDLAAATAAYQKNMQDMTKRMVELLVRCEIELRTLNDQTDKGHDRLVSAFKKSGQVY